MKKIDIVELESVKEAINNSPNIDEEQKLRFNRFLDEIISNSKKDKNYLQILLGAKVLKELFDDYLIDVFDDWK